MILKRRMGGRRRSVMLSGRRYRGNICRRLSLPQWLNDGDVRVTGGKVRFGNKGLPRERERFRNG
jgi:hypothetical protein